VAAKVGYCGLDRRRMPLVGDEIRACWEPGGAVTDASGGPLVPLFGPALSGDQRRDFVEVGSSSADLPASPPDPPSEVEPLFEVPPGATPSGEPRWSLWSDLDA
jgi:hypothetical protein